MVYASYVGDKVHFEPVNAYLSGVTVGLEAKRVGGRVAGFVEGRYEVSSEYELGLLSINLGARFPALHHRVLQVGGQTDLGLSQAHLERLQNENDLLSVGAGFYVDIRVIQRISIIGSIGGRWYFDGTAPTTCNDGTTSNSTGQGTCSHHGGISHYNDKIGNGTGIGLSLGIRFQFGTAL